MTSKQAVLAALVNVMLPAVVCYAVVWIKWTQIEYGKSIFLFLICQSVQSPISFLISDANKRTNKLVLCWVPGRIDWCCVEFLPDKYQAQKDALNRRLGRIGLIKE